MDIAKYIDPEKFIASIIQSKEDFNWGLFIEKEKPTFEFLVKFIDHLDIYSKEFINTYKNEILESELPLFNTKEYLLYFCETISLISYDIIKKYSKIDENNLQKVCVIIVENKIEYGKEFLKLLQNKPYYIDNYIHYAFKQKNLKEIIFILSIITKEELIKRIFINPRIFKEQEFLLKCFDTKIITIKDINFTEVDNIIVFFFLLDKRFSKLKEKGLKYVHNSYLKKYLKYGLDKTTIVSIFYDYYYSRYENLGIDLNNNKHITSIYQKIEKEIGLAL